MTDPMGTLFVANDCEREYGVPFFRHNREPITFQQALVDGPLPPLEVITLDWERSKFGVIHIVRKDPSSMTIAVFVPDGLDHHVAEAELCNEYGGRTRLWNLPVGTPLVD